jgi:hypothetical protein
MQLLYYLDGLYELRRAVRQEVRPGLITHVTSLLERDVRR